MSRGRAQHGSEGFEAPKPRASYMVSSINQSHSSRMNFPPTAEISARNTVLDIAASATSCKFSISSQLVDKFTEYVYQRYGKWHTRNLACYLKLGLATISNPLILKKSTWRKAKYAIEALRSLAEFCRINGISFNVDFTLLRKHVDTKSKS